MMNKIKPEEVVVGARFMFDRDPKCIIEVDRVVDGYVIHHYVEPGRDVLDSTLGNCKIESLINTVVRIPKITNSRRIMKARYSNSVIEVKLVSNDHAVIVNLDSELKEVPGTERIVREDSLIKSYKPS